MKCMIADLCALIDRVRRKFVVGSHGPFTSYVFDHLTSRIFNISSKAKLGINVVFLKISPNNNFKVNILFTPDSRSS
jgi:hypothetical protein